MLTLNKSMYDLSIMVRNVTMTLSPSKSIKTKNCISEEIGILCSRLSLFCDQINDLLINNEQGPSYLSRDEQNIINTYLEDALSGLEKSLERVKENKIESLCYIIEGKIKIVKNIKRIIDGFEIQKEGIDVGVPNPITK